VARAGEGLIGEAVGALADEGVCCAVSSCLKALLPRLREECWEPGAAHTLTVGLNPLYSDTQAQSGGGYRNTEAREAGAEVSAHSDDARVYSDTDAGGA